jgi:hypothetical protein
VAGGRVAYIASGQVVVADAATLAPIIAFPAPAANALGLSDRLVVWRGPDSTGRDSLYAHDLAVPPDQPPVLIAVARTGGTIGRPSVSGTHVVFDLQRGSLSRILDRDVSTGALATLRMERRGGALLLQPSVDAGRLVYVRSTAARQSLLLGPAAPAPGSGDRSIFSTTPTGRRDLGHEPGLHEHHQGYPGGRRPQLPPRPPAGLTVTLWTTALSGTTAYVTRVRHLDGGATRTRILRVDAP